MRRVLIVLLMPCLVGFGLTVPVEGISEAGDETFAGTATGHWNGEGTVDVVSDRGTRCSGTFTFVLDGPGKGAVDCSNGQSGTFAFRLRGFSGHGDGVLGRRRFRLRFG
jgi:hypothetical protein